MTEPVPIRAVQRALGVLSCFDVDMQSASLSDLARATDLPSTTVARLPATLEAERYVRRGPDRRYVVGSRLVGLALAALQSTRLYEMAGPHLRALSEETGGTANLGLLDDDGRVLYLRQSPSRHAIRHATWPGRTIPAQGTAISAALLGRVPAEGYVATRRTIEPDVTAVAAPIFGPDDDIVGALSLTGPTFRISDHALAVIGRAVARQAQRASLELGAALPERAAW